MRIETTLEQMKDSYDWGTIFGEDHGYSDGDYASNPQAVTGDLKAAEAKIGFVRLEDIEELLGSVDGERDGLPWIAVVKLKNGFYLAVSAGCDYTGWDCHAGGSSWVASTLDLLLQGGVSDNERVRLEVPYNE